MTDKLKNSTLLSKTNTGFPEYLDFENLRSEGIDYLGKLSGHLWTDHNVHDPGITIMESLIYAILDLGYRTNLPIEDILSRDPEDKNSDNNFFTPSQILTCNPLTILDYRKLLVDIEGIRNAWIEPKIEDASENDNRPASDSINGLYNVLLDLENTPSNKNNSDEYKEEIINTVKAILQDHRNLCEDFLDPRILEKQKVGVITNIELEENVIAEEVYINVVNALREFITPSPRFYTLQQLLDKKKNIEEIFEGRPFNLTQSHGFVDRDEFEKIIRRKEIHTSDLFNIISKLNGVSRVESLELTTCDNESEMKNIWKLHLKEDHVPEFSIDCSDIKFSRDDFQIFIDPKKYDKLFNIRFQNNGKVLYHHPSSHLDLEIPGGRYREDLDQYFSIQNEFPTVYGISEGDLPDDASDLRKAQALQLKGYLLFYDQLLANYLTQLKNLRTLFSFTSDGNEESRSTYFYNTLDSVPDLQKLIRLKTDEKAQSEWGTEGSTLVFPVSRKNLNKLKESGDIKKLDIEKIDQYFFHSANECEIALQQVKNDLFSEEYECEYVVKDDGCVFYYFLTSSQQFALLSRKYFKTTKDAEQEAATVKYIGTFQENFHSFYLARKNMYSFNLKFNISSYAKYLQIIIEDKRLYRERRQGFLNHLLARFAEKFTDYALLSFRFLQPHILESNEIKAKEKFLVHYPDLSSSRGKSYNYQTNGWCNENISGFEKRFKGLAGIENWERHTLCNFVVESYPVFNKVELDIGGAKYFRSKELYEDEKIALTDAKELFSALSKHENYSVKYNDIEAKYEIVVSYSDKKQATFLKRKYEDQESAIEASKYLCTIFYNTPAKDDIFESRHMYNLKITDHKNNEVRKSKQSYNNPQEAFTGLKATIKQVNDPKVWTLGKVIKSVIGKLYPAGKSGDTESYVDLDAFKIDINDTIIGKPDKFTFDILDKKNTFKFSSLIEFDQKGLATIGSYRLLSLLSNKSAYRIVHDPKTKMYKINIESNKKLIAVNTNEFKSKAGAQKLQDQIIETVKQYQYNVSPESFPAGWKYRYRLGYGEGKDYEFVSTREYSKESFATEAARKFAIGITDIQLKKVNNILSLVPKDITKIPESDKKGISACNLLPKKSYEDKNIDAIKNECSEFLKERAAIVPYIDKKAEAFKTSVRIDEKSKRGTFVYRLIDKDNLIAHVKWSPGIRQISDDIVERSLKHLTSRSRRSYDYLEICLGGDIISKREEANNVTWFHYQVICRNRFYSKGKFKGKELILFESVDGYSDKDEALKAFQENYLQIFKKAFDPANYGKHKFISTEEIYINHTDSSVQSSSKVFIPRSTLRELGTNNEAAIREIIKIVQTYPIRLTDNNAYKFYLIIHEGALEYWESSSEYNTPKEAMSQFLFFLVLLKYPGNYIKDYDLENCEYRIYLREVLAESARRFSDEGSAWGKEGVQKFIGISQTPDAFHKIVLKNCYRYYVACKDPHLLHQVKYKTAQERDNQINNLYKSFQSFEQTEKSILNVDLKKFKIKFMSEEISLDTISIKESITERATEKVIDYKKSPVEFLHEIRAKGLNIKENKLYTTKFRKKNIVISPKKVAGDSLENYKDKMLKMAYFFPIVKKTADIAGGKDKYKINIKLPDYHEYDTKWQDKIPSKCDDDTGAWRPCPPAWESDCDYDTIEDALDHYQKALLVLSKRKNYLPTYDCKCASYGIALHYDPEDYNLPVDHNERIQIHDIHEIVAYNPQCYSNPEMACESIERAKRLINSEGLHLVEHILLRDYYDNAIGRNIKNVTGCEFTWYAEDDDPCSTEEDVQYIPGRDPLSFITTVALPAWPKRFRYRENQLLIENMLYREAPAHVLLRILWLAPHDLYCFEKYYKNWILSEAEKRICDDTYATGKFLKFLFRRNYECFEFKIFCDPCKDFYPLTKDEMKKVKGDKSYDRAHHINHLFNWEHQSCNDYAYIPCNELLKEPHTKQPDKYKEVTETRTDIKEIPEKKEGPAKDIVDLESSRNRFLNTRLAAYKKVVDQITKSSGGNKIAVNAGLFMNTNDPGIPDLNLKIEVILKNEKPAKKEQKELTKNELNKLAGATLCYFLDKASFSKGKKVDIPEFEKSILKLKEGGIDLKGIYKSWNEDEVKKYEPISDVASIIKKLI